METDTDTYRTVVLVASSDGPPMLGDIQRALIDLIRAEGHDPELMHDKDKEDLGGRLAKAVGRKKPWGRDIITAVKNGKLQPGRDFILAVMAMGGVARDAPQVWRTARVIQVYAAGNVKPGTLIDRDSRDCAYCQRPFIAHSWNDLCCSAECDRGRRDRAKNSQH